MKRLLSLKTLHVKSFTLVVSFILIFFILEKLSHLKHLLLLFAIPLPHWRHNFFLYLTYSLVESIS